MPKLHLIFPVNSEIVEFICLSNIYKNLIRKTAFKKTHISQHRTSLLNIFQ